MVTNVRQGRSKWRSFEALVAAVDSMGIVVRLDGGWADPSLYASALQAPSPPRRFSGY